MELEFLNIQIEFINGGRQGKPPFHKKPFFRFSGLIISTLTILKQRQLTSSFRKVPACILLKTLLIERAMCFFKQPPLESPYWFGLDNLNAVFPSDQLIISRMFMLKIVEFLYRQMSTLFVQTRRCSFKVTTLFVQSGRFLYKKFVTGDLSLDKQTPNSFKMVQRTINNYTAGRITDSLISSVGQNRKTRKQIHYDFHEKLNRSRVHVQAKIQENLTTIQ